MKKVLFVLILAMLTVPLFVSMTYAVEYVSFAMKVNTSNAEQILDQGAYYWWQVDATSLANFLAANPDKVITSLSLNVRGLKDTIDTDLYLPDLTYLNKNVTPDISIRERYNDIFFAVAQYLPTNEAYDYLVTPTGAHKYYDYSLPWRNELIGKIYSTGTPGVGVDMQSSNRPSGNVYDLGFFSDEHPSSDPLYTGYNKRIFFSSDAIGDINNWAQSDARTFAFGMDTNCAYSYLSISFDVGVEAVPEPSSLMLLGSGLIGIGFFSVRNKRYS